MMKSLFLAALTLFSTGCTKLGLVVINLPTHFSSTERISDVVFDEASQLKLDIYRPQQVSDESLPVIIFYYGGSYQDGHKDMYKFVAHRLASEGYLVVVPDYQKYPPHKFPVFMEDGATAAAWTYNNVSEYGGDVSRLFVLGHSAGAHIGAHVVTWQRLLQQHELKPNIIRAFAGLAGPYEFIPEEPVYIEIFGPEEKFKDMHVSTYVGGNEPPMLLLHGGKDTIVDVRNMERFAAAIEQAGGDVTTQVYEQHDHVGMITPFAWISKREHPIVQQVLTFFAQHDIQQENN